MAFHSCCLASCRTFRPLCQPGPRIYPSHRCTRLLKSQLSSVPSGTNSLYDIFDELEIPELEDDLAVAQQEMGAISSENGIVSSFGNDADALSSLASGAVVVDRSHCGRLRVLGPDRLEFLHGQTTNSITTRCPGDGCDTVLVTAQARCLDLLTCYVQSKGVMLVVSPGYKGALQSRFDKYIFPGDKVDVIDVSSKTCQFSLLGNNAGTLLSSVGVDVEDLEKRGHGSHTLLSLMGSPVIVALGGGLVPGQGFNLIADSACSGDLWNLLASKGAIPMGSDAWEIARVVAGRPAQTAELNESYNPLEAGLYYAISFEKGCYIGQETISKVENLNAVKQKLSGLVLNGACNVGSSVYVGNTKIGIITSYVTTPSGAHHALAYFGRKSKEYFDSNRTVTVEVQSGSQVSGRVVDVPALANKVATPNQIRSINLSDETQLREEKIRAMQERIRAWQEKQDN